MKKVLALVLAVMMLATVAFANPVENPTTGASSGTTGTEFLPGDTIKIDAEGIMAKDSGYKREGGDKLIKDINSTNYVLSSLKYPEGKALVESVKFNDANDRVDIKLKSDYTLTKPKNIEITFTLKGKKVSGSKPDNIDIVIKQTINYGLNETALYLDEDEKVVIPAEFAKNTVYKVNDSGSVNYGTLEFTTLDPDVDVEVRVYKDDKLYLYHNVDADSDILKKYADEDADITFLNFPGKPTFNATATVRFYKEEGTYIYELKDGNLTAITAEAASAGAAGQTAGKVKWDEDEGCYILKTRTLGNYVFSDVALPLDAVDNTENTNPANPDTGANDVVGIATALAAVALVSAAAVSLKK